MAHYKRAAALDLPRVRVLSSPRTAGGQAITIITVYAIFFLALSLS